MKIPKDKENVFIDLSKLSEKKRNHIYSIIRDRNEFLKPNSYTRDCWKMLNYSNVNERWQCSGENWDGLKDKTELTYTQFLEMMGGESIKSDNTQTLQNALDQIEKLESGKAELLELMAEMKESFDHKAWVTEMELKSFSSRIESLIQKHKV